MSPVDEHRDDVRLLQRRRHADLALEALGADSGGELRREDFDDDFAAEPDFVGDEDARHAAAAELALEGVGSTQRRLELCLEVTHAAECMTRTDLRRDLRSDAPCSVERRRDKV